MNAMEQANDHTTGAADDAARILVIDNYDSFVYTIVGYLKTLGAEVTVVRNDAFDVQADGALDGYDGVLISPLSRESQAKHADLLEGTPCVYLGVNHGEKCSYVMADNEAGAAIAVRYLLQLGHRDLVFLGGRADSLTRVQRVRGFRRALREHGLSGRVLPAPPDTRELRQWAYEQALALFGERTLPHAVLAFSDLTALRILEAAEERGIRVPEDLSLVGYDNVSYAAIPRIHLTTVSQHKFQQGRIAVERLLCQIQGDRRPTADLLQPELVVRSTCAPRTQGGRTL